MCVSNRLIFGLVFLAFAIKVNAQSTLLNAKTAGEIGELQQKQKELDDSKPLPYNHIDDRDLMWSKIVWEKIDLNQKLNYPLLYPLDSNRFGPDRKSLFQVLIDGIKKGVENPDADDAIKEVYSTSYFQQKKDYEEIVNSLKAIFLPDVATDILGQYGVTGTENVDLLFENFSNYHITGFSPIFVQRLRSKPWTYKSKFCLSVCLSFCIQFSRLRIG